MRMTVKPFDQNPDREYIDRLSNHLFDYIMPTLKPTEWMVLCFIIRKTTGWHKNTDKVSLAEIKDGTGIESVTTVNKAVTELENRGYITIQRGPQKRRANIYTLNTNFGLDITISKNDTVEHETVSKNDIVEPKTISKNDTVYKAEVETVSKNDIVEPQTISKNDNTKEHIKEQYKSAESPGKNSNGSNESRNMFAALADLCKIDLSLVTSDTRGKLNQTEKKLRQAGITPEELKRFDTWWYANDWRGKQGQAPTPAQVRELWGQFKERGTVVLK